MFELQSSIFQNNSRTQRKIDHPHLWGVKKMNDTFEWEQMEPSTHISPLLHGSLSLTNFIAKNFGIKISKKNSGCLHWKK